jgi:hypothetical protein
VALPPSDKPLALELILGGAGGPQRRLRMWRAGETYLVTAVPVPAPEGPPVLRLAARYPDGSLEALLDDQPFKVGARQLRLREVRALRWQPKPQAVLHDGRAVAGEVAGLGAVPVRLGEQKLVLDLAKAVEVRLEPPAEVTAVPVTVVALQDGKEVGRVSDTLAVEGAPRAGAGIPGPIKAAVLGQEIVTIPAGNDRLVLHRFDAEEALEKSDLDYLVVASLARPGDSPAAPARASSILPARR